MTRKNENLTVGANNYASLQNEKFLNQDFNKINKINKIFFCGHHSELVSESPAVIVETLKRVQGDNKKNLGNPANLAKITVQKTKNNNTPKPHCSKNTTLSGGVKTLQELQ